MAILKTYDLKGNKLSFANWISNLSPAETPFTSMIGKESVDQTMYSWQIDRLASPLNEAHVEGSLFEAKLRSPTQVQSNFTQIMRKVVRITDTANRIGLYGRASEKAYQMEKAAKEIRRDLEKAVLTQKDAVAGVKDTTPRRFAGFPGLVAAEGLACLDTGAVVHKTHEYDASAGVDEPPFTTSVIFDMTYNLYLAGAKADKVMIHPKHMILFAGWINGAHGAFRLFDGLEEKYNMYVNKFRDPLGQEFTVIPNRHMPVDRVYFFNEADWTQMILREPKTEQLARNGSSEKHMIEFEVGLRHRNPFASGILRLKEKAGADVTAIAASMTHVDIYAGAGASNATKLQVHAFKNGAPDTAYNSAVTVTYTPGTGLSGLTAGTWSNGVWTNTNDVRSNVPGTYVITASTADGLSHSTVLNVHSRDKMLPGGAVTLEEQLTEAGIEAPVSVKAAKAKAKPKA